MADVKAIAKTDTNVNKTPNLKDAGPSSSTNCVVAKGTKIEGNFQSPENVRMDGGLVGEVRCDKKLVMGETSSLEGKIFANEAVIMGRVKGDIVVADTLHLQNTANVQGNISAKYLIVDEGAVFNGDCKIGG